MEECPWSVPRAAAAGPPRHLCFPLGRRRLRFHGQVRPGPRRHPHHEIGATLLSCLEALDPFRCCDISNALIVKDIYHTTLVMFMLTWSQ